ncbi:FkbM family methyltransferase [Pseudomonas sp. PDNC002]|uniref:FkbM family methyltransferase n=1 Tax=Pseudomonas sp. PDNC002 TaxID=2811422 RepID=UPI0019643AE7|nr:FkbM family methyltransferase [Pseudomonas sp. PDNC002]QRY80130.1 FkbM family methyltransferase [Pseudomonas sp. PDNC002]
MKTLLNKLLARPEINPQTAPAPPSRSAAAVAARDQLVNDFFGGWELEDIEVLQRYRYEGASSAGHGEILDWLGIRTDIDFHAWLPRPASGPLSIRDLPVPDDQVHAETIEYIGLICSLERAARSGHHRFVAVELGASYAPWAVAAGVMALRKGFGEVSLVAVEANRNSVPKITRHAKLNGLLDVSNVDLRAIHGAVHVRDEPVYFPKIDTSHDNGAQLTLEPEAQDYRGLAYEYEEVPGLSLPTLCADIPRIDFLHMDLQGAEEALLQDADFLRLLDERVTTLFIATQSRLIEGLALKALSAMNWQLYRERPTVYQQNDRTPDVNGWTLRDGGQIWFNDKPRG